MQALTVLPLEQGSVRLEEIAAPPPSQGALRVQTVAVGICGTDQEILQGKYGAAPPGQPRLVLGHESIGRVVEAPPGSGFSEGDWVVGIVRRPDPVPCVSCAAGEWDMCRNGLYTEHGIKELDGFAREQYRIDPAFAVKVDPGLEQQGVLLEPTSVVAKAWEQIERIGRRSWWKPTRVTVTGAGPIGLLAAMLAIQQGLEVHVLDQMKDGPKPALVRALGAHYHSGTVAEAAEQSSVILDCTGVDSVVAQALGALAPDGILCLTGVSSAGRSVRLDLGAVNRGLVLQNNVVFGSVNANRRHYEAAAQALKQADPAWLSALIARRVPLERWSEAYESRSGDVKTVLQFA